MGTKTITGKVSIEETQATLNDNILADCTGKDPIAAGVGFIRQRGFDDGSDITVIGTDGFDGSTPVLCIQSVKPAGEEALAFRSLAVRRLGRPGGQPQGKKEAAGKKAKGKKSAEKNAAAKKGSRKTAAVKKQTARKTPSRRK